MSYGLGITSGDAETQKFVKKLRLENLLQVLENDHKQSE
jgi:hypothetical protein